MSESPDTQAEADHPLFPEDGEACTCGGHAPSAEPDGETVTFGPNTGVTYGFGGWHFTDQPAPTQDGAEVDSGHCVGCRCPR